MHPKALLELATELLRAVLRFEQPADAVVSAHFRRQRALGARERHALAETVYAVLRRRLLLQHLAQSGQRAAGAAPGAARLAGRRAHLAGRARAARGAWLARLGERAAR